MQLTVLLGFGGDLLVLAHPGLEVSLDELSFQAAAEQLLLDALQLVAEEPIIDIAFDGGQDGGQGRLKRNDFDIH